MRSENAGRGGGDAAGPADDTPRQSVTRRTVRQRTRAGEGTLDTFRQSFNNTRHAIVEQRKPMVLQIFPPLQMFFRPHNV